LKTNTINTIVGGNMTLRSASTKRQIVGGACSMLISMKYSQGI